MEMSYSQSQFNQDIGLQFFSSCETLLGIEKCSLLVLSPERQTKNDGIKKGDSLQNHLKCFHNGIILIVNCFKL